MRFLQACSILLVLMAQLDDTVSFATSKAIITHERISSSSLSRASFQIPAVNHDDQEMNFSDSSTTIKSNDWQATRAQFLSVLTSGIVGGSLIGIINPPRALAFEGGVGGLGKTKPETGVQFFSDLSAPVQNSAGIVSAELKVNNNLPVLVTFQTPWPLLPSTAGLEARDLQQPDSAFVVVVSGKENVPSERPLSKSSMKKLLLPSVFGQQGKFGAYGAPTDVKVRATDDPTVFAVSFTTLTPGLRESERQVLIKYCSIGPSDLVMLVTGTTLLRFKKQEATLQKVVNSFNAVPAPSSQLR